ncbi:DMT family transporter [Flexithrix dorotheae]|uniref:DMT family transporter n=1 Tax=Flexithrix dorotheae TaxID=70993 RepID=UPI000477841E|nr:DMT family transporter [Flexithrix dorotheae]
MNKRQNSYQLTGVIFALGGAVFFSAKAVMVKLAYQYDIDPVSLLLLRMGFALPIYLFIGFRPQKTKRNLVISSKDYLWVIAAGFVGYYLASYFDFFGLQYISASYERLILFIYPTLVVILSRIVFRKPITKIQLLAIVLTYIGIYVAFMENLNIEDNKNFLLGGFFIFLSALTYASYLMGSGWLIPKFGTQKFTSYAMIVSCVCVIIHFAFQNTTNLFGYSWEVYALGLAMALISTVIPSFMISEAIKRLEASNVSIIASVGPISTIILAAIFLNEQITSFQVLGTIIVILGVILVGKAKK